MLLYSQLDAVAQKFLYYFNIFLINYFSEIFIFLIKI